MRIFLISWLMAEWSSSTIALAILALTTACGCVALLIMIIADIFFGGRR